jgi:hypothetical protein
MNNATFLIIPFTEDASVLTKACEGKMLLAMVAMNNHIILAFA